MADTKISNLTAATLPLTGAELLVLAIAGVTDNKITFANLAQQALKFGDVGTLNRASLSDGSGHKLITTVDAFGQWQIQGNAGAYMFFGVGEGVFFNGEP